MSVLIVHPGSGTVINAEECRVILSDVISLGFLEKLSEGDPDAHESVRRYAITLRQVMESPEVAGPVLRRF